MTICKIQWIDARGKLTPDENPAIMECRTKDRWSHIDYFRSSYPEGRTIHFDASEWFPICEHHAKKLSDEGMHIWETRPLERIGR